MSVKFGSVCSGIEAASVAWDGLGWSAAWFSEIEKFPSAVLKHHYPHVPNLGDMTTLPERILSAEVEAPDVFCGGTPCQAFSVAGKRQSLNDVRGNLSLTFCEISNAIDYVRIRTHRPPAIIFWENVPGVLNTPDNAFGCFLAELAGEDEPLQPPGKKWSNAGIIVGPQRTVAWRVLDAQYFGLAQRRKRVFVIASARKRFNPAAVLFEFEGLRRDTPPSRKTGEEIAAFTPGSFGGYNENVKTLKASGGDIGGGSKILHLTSRMKAFGEYINDNTASTMKARDANSATDLVTEVNVSVFENHPTDSRIKLVDVCPTITSRWGTGGNNVPIALAENTIGRKPENGGNGDGFKVNGPMYTLNCSGVHGVAHSMQVRRLTPVECERLQGFPDNYTSIPWRKKSASECPDGPRYKALGNSWAVPVVAWIGKRINKELKK